MPILTFPRLASTYLPGKDQTTIEELEARLHRYEKTTNTGRKVSHLDTFQTDKSGALKLMNEAEATELLRIIQDNDPLELRFKDDCFEIGYRNPEKNYDGHIRQYFPVHRFNPAQIPIEMVTTFAKATSPKPTKSRRNISPKGYHT
jgi:hypothetical protein